MGPSVKERERENLNPGSTEFFFWYPKSEMHQTHFQLFNCFAPERNTLELATKQKKITIYKKFKQNVFFMSKPYGFGLWGVWDCLQNLTSKQQQQQQNSIGNGNGSNISN